MFADTQTWFYWHKDINAFILKVNNELHKINQWFISNKLSLNIRKKPQNIHFSMSGVNRMIIPDLLPKLRIGQNQLNFLV